MSLKNIQLINAEEVSNLFQTKYDKSSFIGVHSGDKQIDLATYTSSTNKIVQGEQLEIKIGASYLIELDDFSSEIELELKNLGWGLILFINGEAYYLLVNSNSKESEFSAIKNYPSLKIVDYGSGKNEAIKNLDCLVKLKNLHTLNLDNCPALVDLKSLSELTTLEILFLDGFSIDSEFHYISCLKSLRGFSQNRSTIKDLNHLKDIKQINLLSLSYCVSLTSLEVISGLTNLTALDLGSCKSLTNLEVISGLTNLTSLNLERCSSLTSIEGISGLKKLTSLNLEWCDSLTSLKGISGLSNLTSLDLNYCLYLTSLEGISGLTNLTSLNLERYKSLTSLEGISGLTNLTSLNLSWCKSLTSLEGITGLTNLTSLNLSWSESLTSLKGISGLTNLTALDLGSCKSLTNLEVISGLTNLTSLNLERCSSLTSLEGITGLTNLTSLNLNRCSSLTSLEGISGLTNLTSLNLERYKSLTSLEGISGLTNLTSLNLSWCKSLTSLEGITGLTNLTSLNLSWSESLTSLKGISGLTNLTLLNLLGCTSLTCLEGISDLSNLTSLNLGSCKSLTSLEGIAGLSNLASLDLSKWSSLTSLEGISGLTNLTALDLGSCKSLTNLEVISGLTNLTSLNLERCSSLTSIEGISGLKKLTSLNLEWCDSLTSLKGISGLTNLTSLNLYFCSSLTSIEGISGLTNLTSLNLYWCKSLTSLEVISGLTNLTSLDLSCCDSLTSLEGISGLTNLTSLDLYSWKSLTSLEVILDLSNLTSLKLGDCKSLIFIKKLNSLQKLQKLELTDCGNIRDFEELIHCPNLKEVSWIHEASCSYVLTGSAVRRKDSLFIAEKIERWVKDLQFSKDPIAFANELIAAVSLIKNETLAKEQFIHLAQAMRERGLSDGESGNAFNVTTWELWVEAVMKQSNELQEILELTTQNIDSERELEVFAAPILTALADISILYPSAKEWAINFVMELVAPFKENEDWARTIAPAAAVFYAGMELQEEVAFWLNKGTHPHIPKWKDTILLALVNYFAPKNQFSEARKYQQQISLPDLQDQARIALVKAMSASLPNEALDEFSNINDFILQTSLAKQLALEPSMLQSSEGVYQLLLCLEQTPELFSEFVSNVLEKQPSSQFVQSIEALFAKPSETISLTLEFITLCDNPEVIDFVGQRRIEKLKEELKGSEMEERTILLSSFMSLLVAKNLLNIEESNELQQILITKA